MISKLKSRNSIYLASVLIMVLVWYSRENWSNITVTILALLIIIVNYAAKATLKASKKK